MLGPTTSMHWVSVNASCIELVLAGVGGHHGTSEVLQQVVLFVGVRRRRERGELVALIAAEGIRYPVEGVVQVGGDEFIALADVGGLEPVRVLDLCVAPLTPLA